MKREFRSHVWLRQAVVGALLVSGAPHIASAETLWDEVLDSAMVTGANSPVNPKNQKEAFNTTTSSVDSLSDVVLSKKDTCIGSICTPSTVVAPSLGDSVAAGYRAVPRTAILPGNFDAGSELIQGTVLPLQNQANLIGSLNVQQTTLFLTESAVAQGVANGGAQAAAMYTNLLLSELRSMMIAQQMGEGRQTIRDYIWCIQKTLEGSNPADFVGLPQAISKCRDERGLLITSSLWTTPDGIGAMPTDDVANNINNLLPPDISSDPNSARKTLSALIFNEELPVNPVARLLAIGLKTDFVTVFGDVAYDTQMIPDLISGTRRGGVERIEPTEGRDEYVDQTAIDIMEEISTVMRLYCAESLVPPVSGVSVFDAERFWNNLDTSTYATLSVPGFGFNRAIGNMFVRSFRNVMGVGYGVTECTTRAGPPVSWDVAIRTNRAGAGTLLANDEYLRLIYNYAQSLARARLYSIGEIAYAKLDQLTSAAEGESSVAATGQRLILASLGLSSGEAIKAAHERSLDSLRQLTGGQTEQDRNQISRASAGSASVFGR